MRFRTRQLAAVLALIVAVMLGYRAITTQDTATSTPNSSLTLVDQFHSAEPKQLEAPPAPVSTAPPAPQAELAGAFRGRVFDAVSREPVRVFKVQLMSGASRGQPPVVHEIKAKDGRFELKHVAAGDWFATVSAPGYQRFELSTRITPGEPSDEALISLLPGQQLQGRVYDAESRMGVAGASITVREAHVGRFEGNFRARAGATSDEEGRFLIDGVPVGRITLDAHAPGYASRELDVLVDKGTQPVEIALDAGALIAGRLTAPDGVTPVAGYAGVYSLDANAGSSSLTGAQGEFSFENLSPGRYRLTGRAQGRTVERQLELARNQRITDIVLALADTGHAIRGVVSGLRPEEFEHVSIYVHREDETFFPTESVHLDKNGSYVIYGVRPGPVTIAADVSSRRQISRKVDMPEGADLTVDLAFPPGSRLSGRVTRAGKPVAGVYIHPRPRSDSDVSLYGTSTSRDGRYAMNDVPPGEYVLWVGEHRSRPVQVSGDTVFDIDVPSAQVAGRVLEARGEAPVVGADVDLWSTRAGAERIRLRTSTDHSGDFELTGVEPGNYMLTAYKPGYEMVREYVSYDGDAVSQTMRLARSAGVPVTLHRKSDGPPVREFMLLEQYGDVPGSNLYVRVDEQGVGYIPAALAGATFTIESERYAPLVISQWDGLPLALKLTSEPKR